MSRSLRKLVVVMVAYRSGAILDSAAEALDQDVALLRAELPEHHDLEVELVVVENSAADAGLPRASRECLITRVSAHNNPGFAAAVNLGLASCQGEDFVLLLNPDARLRPGCLRALITTAQENDAALVGPLLCDSVGSPSGVSERAFHSVGRELKTQLIGSKSMQPPFGHSAASGLPARCLTGACLLAERDFLRSVGGLDEALPMYLEDVWLCWQAHARNRLVLFARSAQCEHDLGGSSDGSSFSSSDGLFVLLLSARVEFVRRTRGRTMTAAIRFTIAIGASARWAKSGFVESRHRNVVRWAVFSGQPPPWENGPML